MEPIPEPIRYDRHDRRLPLVIAGLIAVLVGLAFAFAWPW